VKHYNYLWEVLDMDFAAATSIAVTIIAQVAAFLLLQKEIRSENQRYMLENKQRTLINLHEELVEKVESTKWRVRSYTRPVIGPGAFLSPLNLGVSVAEMWDKVHISEIEESMDELDMLIRKTSIYMTSDEVQEIRRLSDSLATYEVDFLEDAFKLHERFAPIYGPRSPSELSQEEVKDLFDEEKNAILIGEFKETLASREKKLDAQAENVTGLLRKYVNPRAMDKV
jgi:hypothetical protein